MDDHLHILGQLHGKPQVHEDMNGPIAYMPVRLERIEFGNNSTCIGLTIAIRGANALECTRFKKHDWIEFVGRLNLEAWPADEDQNQD